MDSRDVLKQLRQAGWRKVAQQGSHIQLKHPPLPGRVTVPHPKRDIPVGTVRSLERQAALRLRR